MAVKFLIIQTAFTGDAVLATSLVENLHARYPDARIDFLLRKGNEGLLTGHPFIEQVLVWDKQQKKTVHLLSMLKKIRSNRYDAVINVQRYSSTGVLTALSGAREQIGFDKNPLSFLFTKKAVHEFGEGESSIHEIQRNHRLIDHLVTDIAMRPRLYPTADDQAQVEKYLRLPFITISPASVWFTKQYPPQKWAAFINRLSHHYAIYLLGGMGDRSLSDGLIQMTGSESPVNLCGELNFLQSAALMRQAAMNFVNDSAPMHLASAVNAPVTAVYCSTIPAFGYGPLSDVRFIVEREQPLYCRPCGLHGHVACPEGHFRCALEIDDQQLLRSLPAVV